MATTSPARIDDDLYASAKLAGSVQSRSASQQVAHWARIGREIEASDAMSHKEIVEVLAGSRSYDELNPKEQAVVRAEWTERMRERRESLDLVGEFSAGGRTWVELTDDGTIVEHGTEAGRRSPATSGAKRGSKGRVGSSSKRKAMAKPRKAAAKTKKSPAKRARPAAAGSKSRAAG